MSKPKPVADINRASPEIVSLIEGLLERAKKGEVQAFAYVVVAPGGEVGTGWQKSLDRGGYHYLNSGCARLAARMATD